MPNVRLSRRYFVSLALALMTLAVPAHAQLRCFRYLRLLFEPGPTRVERPWTAGMDESLAKRLESGENVPSTALPTELHDADAKARVIHFLRAEAAYAKAWKEIRVDANALLAAYRKSESGENSLENMQREIRELLHHRFGVSKLAYHRNMHGGAAPFLAATGIRATFGDRYGDLPTFTPHGIPVPSGPKREIPTTVFYYPETTSLSWLLESATPSGNHVQVPHVLVVFDLDRVSARPDVKPYRNEIAAGIELPKGTAVGVPPEDFAVIPLPIMTNVNELAGVTERLTQGERAYLNLVMLRSLLRDAEISALQKR